MTDTHPSPERKIDVPFSSRPTRSHSSASPSSTSIESALASQGGPLALGRAVALWLSVASTTVVFSSAVLLSYPFVLPFDRQRHKLHAIGIVWARAIVALNPWWRFHIEGAENLPQVGKPVVIVSNHNSQTDILAIFLLGQRFRWLSKESIFKVPMLGWAMKAIGYVGVKRGDKASHLACMARSQEHLEAATSMVFFPEGTRSKDGCMGVFKSGAFRLAKEAKADVLPVTLIGTETLLPKGSIFPNVTDVRIVVHPVIPCLNKSADDLMDEARALIASALPEARRKPRSQK